MQRFGKFEIRDLLGEGGFGRVFRAYDPGLKREVAIKTCRLPDPMVRRRFLREAEIAAGLRHPNIVVVHELGEHGGEPFMVQEFLPGEDLESVIARQAPIAVDVKVRWLRDIADALAFAHEHGVVHRDIKPQNIRILPDGGVRVLDFGIAKRSVDRASTALTQTGFSIGTIGYMAPEQLAGAAFDHRADIFSFGAVAFRLLTYAEAFDGETAATVFYKIAHVHPTWPPLVARACAPNLIACIDRCLAKRPDDRPQSCRDVVDVMNAALASRDNRTDGTGAPARPGSAAPQSAERAHTRTRMPSRVQRRVARALAGALLLTAVGALIHTARRTPVAGSTATSAVREPPPVESSDVPLADDGVDLTASAAMDREAAAAVQPSAPQPGTALVAVVVDGGSAGTPVAGAARSVALDLLDKRLGAAGFDFAAASADATSDAVVLASAVRLGRAIAMICRIDVTDVALANEFGMSSVTVAVSLVALTSPGRIEIARAAGVATGAGTSAGDAAAAAVQRALAGIAEDVAHDLTAAPARIR